jgi:hypothetical protein
VSSVIRVVLQFVGLQYLSSLGVFFPSVMGYHISPPLFPSFAIELRDYSFKVIYSMCDSGSIMSHSDHPSALLYFLFGKLKLAMLNCITIDITSSYGHDCELG